MQIRAARLSRTGAPGVGSRLETRKLFRHCWSTYSAQLSKVTNAPIYSKLAIKFGSPLRASIRRSIRRKESLDAQLGNPSDCICMLRGSDRVSILIGRATLCNTAVLKGHSEYWNAYCSTAARFISNKSGSIFFGESKNFVWNILLNILHTLSHTVSAGLIMS